MRLNLATKFPHPVLQANTSDFSTGEFTVEVAVSENIDSGALLVHLKTTLSQPDLARLVSNEEAKIVVFVECLRTYYNRVHDIGIGSDTLSFTKGELLGTVKIRPYVIASKKVKNFQSNALHPELQNRGWVFAPADILGVAPDYSINVGLDKLAPIESIFSLSISDEVTEGETKLSLESEKIVILADKRTCEGLNRMRSDGLGKVTLLNGVYLPVIMSVLEALRTDQDLYSQYRWHRVFEARCEHLDINTSEPKLLEDAQKLLRSPLGRLLEAREFNS